MILSQYVGLSAAISNIIAWVAGVIFAYITNKIFVFRSLCTGIKELTTEFG